MQMPFEDLLKILVSEVFSRRNTIFVMFAIISLSMLAVGSVWPKRYTATAIIIADDSDILQPLLEGTAEASRVTNYASNAREIIFGEKIMNQILIDSGWLKTNPSDFEEAQIKRDIKQKVSVDGIGGNLIKVEMHDSKPMRAFIIVQRMAELFIEEGEKSKINESQAAFDFIQKQVNEYLQKLTIVEEQLEAFRTNNPDARPGSESLVTERINRLTADIERTQLELSETIIRHDSLQQQLSGEAAITISMSKEGQYRSKISTLQTTLETLRLDYKETYPDIVRIKHQIDDLKASMNNEIRQREEAKLRARSEGSSYIDEAIRLNPLYQQLRSDASASETRIVTLKTRIFEMNKMLNKEFDKAKRIHGGEAELSKLTRDYEVNQEIYQDLLRRMERARVSKNLDEENQGLTFKIQEPAKIPLLPTGIRFIHFAFFGLVLGFAVPIGLIYLMLQIDPKIRFSKVLSDDLNLPVLAVINKFSSNSDNRKTKINLMILILGFVMIFIIYGYVGWVKYTGQL